MINHIALSPFEILLDNTLDITQTTTLVVITAALIYVVLRLERSLSNAAGSLSDVLTGVARNAKRLDQIEVQLDEVERQQRDRGSGGA